MNKLTQEQQQLVLDFYFNCGEPEDIVSGRDLVAADPEASRLYVDLENTLGDLDHIKYESCPNNLVDLTVARLKLAAMGSKVSNDGLNQLLEQEQKMTSVSTEGHKTNHSLRPLFEVLAAAAAIVLAAGILFPSFGLIRQRYQRIVCGGNLGAIGEGFAKYRNDNDNGFSKERVQAGVSWFKIGDQGEKSQSNTRYPFKLILMGYLDDPKVFVCKGNKKATPFDARSADGLHDFPSHENISYSFSLLCDKGLAPLLCDKKIIASDLNPVFQKVRGKVVISQKTGLKLCEQLKESNSPNHGGRGQNLLYGDGSVKYVQSRIINGDDIFTIDGVDTYTGCEMPAGSNDIFLAP